LFIKQEKTGHHPQKISLKYRQKIRGRYNQPESTKDLKDLKNKSSTPRLPVKQNDNSPNSYGSQEK